MAIQPGLTMVAVLSSVLMYMNFISRVGWGITSTCSHAVASGLACATPGIASIA